jgi:hypothetical protein
MLGKVILGLILIAATVLLIKRGGICGCGIKKEEKGEKGSPH